MNECLVSLIIPVYNAEKYIKKCLTSAVNQTLENIEIVVVNDGSTDNSLFLIGEYAQKDKRIKIINQENCGVGAARNAGIAFATGEYVAFLDSDDWMHDSFLEKMYLTSQQKNADIVVCNYMSVIKGFCMLPVISHVKSKDISKGDALRKLIGDSSIRSFLWNKLFKRSLFNANNISFPNGLYFEDMATTFKLFFFSNKIAIINDCLYYYVQRRNSITKKINQKRIYDNITAIVMIKEFLTSNDCFMDYISEYKYLCFKMRIFLALNSIFLFKLNDKTGEYEKIRHKLKEFSTLDI